jgi:SAM-dependent methyltransferase
MDQQTILDLNQKNYDDLYKQNSAFLRYPADWVIRFHNMYMKANIPSGRVLDYGCGSANNSVFFMKNGYDTYGVDVSESALGLVQQNLKANGLPETLVDHFSVVPTYPPQLPFEDNFFDFILSNQVLYYLPTAEHIHQVCQELSRCLRPGGVVFFTMMGPKNYYIQEHTKAIHEGKVHEIRVETPGHRLEGVKELIYLVNDEAELKALFPQFQPLSVGYFDQSMFDLTSNFHWIFIGQA